jgi:hypothetical protein
MVIEDGMIVNSWEKHLHHVGIVIQRLSTGLQISSQVRHISAGVRQTLNTKN